MRFLLIVLLAVLCVPAISQTASIGPMNGYVDSVASGLQSQITPLSTWSASMQTKMTALPVSGPGAGQCSQTIVPSNLISYSGVAGVAGSCSLIVMCGTSSAYVVKEMNVGSGC